MESSSTTRAQRIGIWIIAIALTAGTLMGFFAMILSSDEQKKSQKVISEYQKSYEKFSKESSEQQADLDKRKDELAKRYTSEVQKLKSHVGKFESSKVKKLDVKVIKKGTGDKITKDTTYAAYYIGWNEKAKIFDSSLDDKKLRSPLIVRPGGVIEGWSEAMDGRNIGGVYLLTIPSAKAYGDQEKSEDIPANSSLKFVVMPVEKLKTIKEPAVTQEVIEAYGQQPGQY